MFNLIKKRIINKSRLLNVFLITLIVLACTTNKVLAFGNDGKFIKLKNVPLGQFIYCSPTEVFFPGGDVSDKNNKSLMNVSAKVYNIQSQETRVLGVMPNIKRDIYKIIDIDNGRILLLGGHGRTKEKVAEIYDKNLNKFTIIGNSNFGHHRETNVFRLDENIFLLINGSYMEIFNSKTSEFTITGNKKIVTSKDDEGKKIKKDIYTLNDYYSLTKAVKLNDGRIYIVGWTEYYGGKLKAEIYDPITNKSIPAKAPEHGLKPIVTLNDGKVLFVSGYMGYIYDPKTDTIVKAPKLRQWRNDHQVILLSDGNVLVLGGEQLEEGVYRNSNLHIEKYNHLKNEYRLLNKRIKGNIETATMSENCLFIYDEYSEKAYLYKY